MCSLAQRLILKQKQYENSLRLDVHKGSIGGDASWQETYGIRDLLNSVPTVNLTMQQSSQYQVPTL